MPDGALDLFYDAPPPFLGIYRRILLGRRARYVPGTTLPAFNAVWRGARAGEGRIAQYCAACGLEFSGVYPLLYPHVLTSPIHIDIISQPAFPLSALGAVHARIHILQHRPIPADAAVDVTCRLTESRVLKQGLEFDICTTLAVDGERCWESVSANLIRGKKLGELVEPSPLAQLPDFEPTAECTWTVAKDMGWRYAKITGDFNPIHVSRVMAKFFGFRRDIIHGMWSGARCLAHLPQPDADRPIRTDLLFKGPVFMESEVVMKHAESEAGHAFDLYCGDNPRPVIRGRVHSAEPGALLVPEDDA